MILLCAWNGNIESKHAVVRYMKDHAREKDTAAWLAQEYGGSNSLFVVRAGSPEEMQLPWPKVQRRLAQLIQEDRFYTEEEQDRFDNIDPIAIREALEERGIVNGQVADPEKLDNDPFIQRVMSDAEQIAAAEAEQTSEVSISDEEYDAVRSPIPQRTSYDPATPVYAVEIPCISRMTPIRSPSCGMTPCSFCHRHGISHLPGRAQRTVRAVASGRPPQCLLYRVSSH